MTVISFNKKRKRIDPVEEYIFTGLVYIDFDKEKSKKEEQDDQRHYKTYPKVYGLN